MSTMNIFFLKIESKKKFQGQGVEFHEIEVGDRIILPVFMRLKLQFFMRSNSKPNLT
jgi:hypothetical protein